MSHHAPYRTKIPPVSLAGVVLLASLIQPLHAQASREFERSVARVARQQAVDDSIAEPAARTILLTHGRPTPRVMVLLHGLTDSPRQFETLARQLYDDGNNVFVPRLPHHGLKGGDARALSSLRAAELRAVADWVVDVAHGLGDSTVVMGLSMGGTVGAWIAETHAVTRAVLVAPAIQPGRIPSMFERSIVGLMDRLPNWTRLSRPDSARPDREPGFSTRAAAEILQLGESVLASAGREAPRTSRITLLLNANDHTVKGGASKSLAQDWGRHGATVTVYELPGSMRLPHNIVDARGRPGGDTVLELLRELAYDRRSFSDGVMLLSR